MYVIIIILSLLYCLAIIQASDETPPGDDYKIRRFSLTEKVFPCMLESIQNNAPQTRKIFFNNGDYTQNRAKPKKREREDEVYCEADTSELVKGHSTEKK